MDGNYIFEVLTVSGWRGAHGYPVNAGKYTGGFQLDERNLRGQIQRDGMLIWTPSRCVVAPDMWRETGYRRPKADS